MSITKEQLKELYTNQGLTVRQCAETLGLPTPGAISWGMKKFGILSRPKGVLVGYKRMPFTPTHRGNLSKSHIGKVGFWTGKKRSPEDIEKFRESHLGKKQSDETKQKRMESVSGKNHYNWKDGITPLVRQIRRCFKYRQWRTVIFTRDKYTCVLCGKTNCWVEGDHYPKSFSEIFNRNKINTMQQAMDCEEFWDTKNGRTLCQRCHNKTKEKHTNPAIIRLKYEAVNQYNILAK